MFSSIRLRNFKCYKDSGDIPLCPLTVIVGKNNSGKSTILHALLLLKQSMEDALGPGALVTSGPLVELGGWYDIIHGADSATEKAVRISVAVHAERRRAMLNPAATGHEEMPVTDRLDLSFSCPEKTHVIQTDRCTLWRDEKRLIDYHLRGNKWSSDVFPAWASNAYAPMMIGFLPRFGYRPQTEPAGVDPQEKAAVLSGLYGQDHFWSEVFRFMHRIGPLRAKVPWYSGVGTRASSEYGQGGQDLLAALARTGDWWGHNSLRDQVNKWVSERLHILERVEVKNVDASGIVRKLVGHEHGAPCDINVAAMGEGVSQILPIIATSVSRGQGTRLLVEQPEIHLHPALQADLADLFIELAMQEDRQVIVETHSEHLLLRIRRRVAEGKLDPEKVAILFVEKKGPESKVRRLEMNGKGHFDDWPDGFFDEAYQEAMALAMASAKG